MNPTKSAKSRNRDYLPYFLWKQSSSSVQYAQGVFVTPKCKDDFFGTRRRTDIGWVITKSMTTSTPKENCERRYIQQMLSMLVMRQNWKHEWHLLLTKSSDDMSMMILIFATFQDVMQIQQQCMKIIWVLINHFSFSIFLHNLNNCRTFAS